MLSRYRFPFHITNKRGIASIDQELKDRESELTEIRSQQAKLQEMQSLKEELKFISPTNSYWDFGLGVSVKGDTVHNPEGVRKIGYHTRFGYCFYSKVCTTLKATVGQIKTSLRENRGYFFNGAGLVDVYLHRHIFVEVSAGYESSNYRDVKINQQFVGADGGLAFSPTKSVDLTIQGGAKKYFDNQQNRGRLPLSFETMVHFKF